MAAAKDKALVKILAQIPNHWFLPAESLWGRRVASGHYEIKNIPFFAYDLNLGDVVRARREEPDCLPEVRSVVRRSGNRTLRVIFKESVPLKRRLRLVQALKPLGVTCERWDDTYFALNISKPGDYDAVEAKLKALRREHILSYERCEARVRGSFDSAPPRPKTARAQKTATKKATTGETKRTGSRRRIKPGGAPTRGNSGRT